MDPLLQHLMVFLFAKASHIFGLSTQGILMILRETLFNLRCVMPKRIVLFVVCILSACPSSMPFYATVKTCWVGLIILVLIFCQIVKLVAHFRYLT